MTRPADIRLALVDVALAGRRVDDIRRRVGQVDDQLRQSIDRHALAGTDVVRLADVVGRRGEQIRLDHVGNVHEITSLCPVTVDGKRLVLPGTCEEGIDDAAVVGGDTAGTVDVGDLGWDSEIGTVDGWP